MNKTILLGRLTKNPDIKYSQTNNVMIANFTLAVDRRYVKQGEERQSDFINIVAYSKLAEFVNKYISKGIQICVSGRIQTRSWDDDNGQRHYVTEIIAEEIDFADAPKKSNENVSDKTVADESQVVEETDKDTEFISDTDDLPF